MTFNHKLLASCLIVGIIYAIVTPIAGDGFRLPDQEAQQQPAQQQNIFQPQVQQPQLQQQQQQPQQLPQTPANFGEERGRSSILSIFGLGQDNDPYLARSNQNCLSGDLSECFKTQALNTFDEIFYRDAYPLTDLARVVRLPETHYRSLQQEPFEYSEEPRNEDSDWDQMVKYALRRAERFIKSSALEVEIPEELTEAGKYQARFIGEDLFDSELEYGEEKHRVGGPITRKKLKKLIIPMLLILKIFKLKLLLFLPFILGIVGLKKVLGLAAIVLPGVFAYFKLCRPPGAPGAGFGSSGGGIFSGLFNSKPSYPVYTPTGVGSSTIYHHHEHYDGVHGHGHGSGGHYSQPYYRQEPTFAQPYSEYYSKNSHPESNSVSFGDPHEAAYSGYYSRNSGKDIKSEQQN